MNWMTFLWPMVTGASVTLGLISLRISFGEIRRLPYLFFSLSALAVAAISVLELVLMRTTSLASYDFILRWAAVPIFLMVASVTGFVRTFFNAGKVWMAWTGVALNGACQLANLLMPTPVVRYAVALHQEETLGGAQYTVPTITSGSWTIVEFISVLFLLGFILDASLAVWRRGDQRRAVIVGGGIFLFLTLARGHALLVEDGYIQTPYMVSFSFIWVLIAMAYELINEVLRSGQLSRELQESEQRMGLAAESANLGLWVWDIAHDEVWTTDTGRTLFGFAPDQRLNYEAFSQRVHPEDRPHRDRVLQQTVKVQVPYSLEYRIHLPDGKHRWIASRGRCINGPDGRGKRLLGVLIDITAQKEAEFQLQRQREEMAHLSRVSTMGQLASSLAHELNQPLGAILRNAEAAEIFLESDQPDLEELRAILADIRKDDQRAGDVIDRLRTLLKRHNIESVPLKVHDLLHDVVALTRADAVARQVTLSIGPENNIPPVLADRVHLQQVLLNLVLNAMDAVTGLAVGKKQVTLRAKYAGYDLVEIAVSDTGTGISEDNLKNIFAPFFTTKNHGMGMGLAISRTIVEAHGGTIRAENNADGGASFRFTLKVAKKGAS